MPVDDAEKLLPFSVVGFTKNSAPQLKEMLRSYLPPVFKALKSTFVLLEGMEVDAALKHLERIRQVPLAQLTNVQFLADFISRSGLHASGGDGSCESEEYEWPRTLAAYVGKGLQIWQYPTQFSKYLVFLSQFQIRSHLEIGVSYGGAFVFSVEYLHKLNPTLTSYCIDVVSPSLLVQRFARRRKFTYITDKSCELYKHIHPEICFDLVFVDGDHSSEGVMRDFELVKDKSNIIAFHDIVNFKTSGAIEAWEFVKTNYASIYDFFEFTDQYDEILAKQPGKTLFGIGVAVRKSLAAKPLSKLL